MCIVVLKMPDVKRKREDRPKCPYCGGETLLRLSEHWHNYCTFQSEPAVPWANNATERAIGRMKMRARTVRGYKSWQGMEAGLLLAGSQAV